MPTDTYITRLEDVVKHPEMMINMHSHRADLASLLAKCRELDKQLCAPGYREYPLDVMAEHTYECAKRE